MTDKMPARIDIRLAPPAGLTREAPFVEEVPAAGATEGDDAFDLIEAGIDGLLRELMRGTQVRG